MTRAEYTVHIYLAGIAGATERMLELRDEIRYQQDLTQEKDLTADRVQSSGIGNPTEQRALKVIALKERLEEQIEELLEYRIEALRLMDAAELTASEQQIIRDRYFPSETEVRRPPTWEDIARQRGYSDKHIYKVRRKALLKMAAVMEGQT